jgi:group I intron endonuclease
MSDNIYSQFFDESTSSQNEEKIYYILYQTTNLVNQKIYVGKHVTKNLDDGYLGSGKLLMKAINRYGIENFNRIVLLECHSLEELNQAEANLVTPEFVARDDTYNIALGGGGGWYHVNIDDRPDNKFRGRSHSNESKQKISQKMRGRKYPYKKRDLTEEARKKIGEASRKRLTGIKRSEETKRKISEAQQNKILSATTLEKLQHNIAIARQHKPATVSNETKMRVSESLKKAWAEGKRQKRDYSFLQADVDAGLSVTEIQTKHNLWRGAVRYAFYQGQISHCPKRKKYGRK